MNKFNKSLVAIATAFAVSTAGVSVASAQDPTETSSITSPFSGSSRATEGEDGTDGGSSDYFQKDIVRDGKVIGTEFDIAKVTGIFSLITGAIGVISAVWALTNKLNK